ncbi:MAG TPA: hypothetical protein VF311_15120 [Terriglobales bacterium]|jgi:hypothetical protein
MASKSASIRPTRTGGSDHIFPTDDYRTTTDGAKQCSLLFSLGFLFALFIGRALACGDLVEGAPFRFHPHVGVPREHGPRDVARDAHDHLVTRARLRKLRDQRVTVIVPPAIDLMVAFSLDFPEFRPA